MVKQLRGASPLIGIHLQAHVQKVDAVLTQTQIVIGDGVFSGKDGL